MMALLRLFLLTLYEKCSDPSLELLYLSVVLRGYIICFHEEKKKDHPLHLSGAQKLVDSLGTVDY